jgi:hypothetical protein
MVETIPVESYLATVAGELTDLGEGWVSSATRLADQPFGMKGECGRTDLQPFGTNGRRGQLEAEASLSRRSLHVLHVTHRHQATSPRRGRART